MPACVRKVYEWLARARESRPLLRNAAQAIASWEREHGGITEAELAATERAWRG